MACQVSMEGYKIRHILINILKENYCILWTDVAPSHQKLGDFKNPIVLDIENLLWKSDFGTFWQLGKYIIFFEYVDF